MENVLRFSRHAGSYIHYIGTHADMQLPKIRQADVRALATTSPGGKKGPLHVHVSLPCTGGSPDLNFTTSEVKDRHVREFQELLKSLGKYFKEFEKFDSGLSATFELPNNNRQ